MDDLIRRVDVLNLAKDIVFTDDKGRPVYKHICVNLDHVRSIPAVDAVEVVHAYWVNGHESRWQNVSDTYTCSVCGEPATKAFGTSVKSRYCPWCGARMDGKEEHNATD